MCERKKKEKRKKKRKIPIFARVVAQFVKFVHTQSRIAILAARAPCQWFPGLRLDELAYSVSQIIHPSEKTSLPMPCT
jgi:hypothetical protein